MHTIAQKNNKKAIQPNKLLDLSKIEAEIFKDEYEEEVEVEVMSKNEVNAYAAELRKRMAGFRPPMAG